MRFIETTIAGAFEIRLDVHEDGRGRFNRVWCERGFVDAGIAVRFVQMNHSVTLGRGTVRGLHYQRPPAAEAKLVGCVAGRAFDVAVDLRAGSPTFLKWASVTIDPATSFFIPEGCAHGFQALEDEVGLVYLHSAAYAAEHENGLRADDPALAIDWPLPIANRSERDEGFALIDASFEGLSP